MMFRLATYILLGCGLIHTADAADDLAQAFRKGNTSGNIRLYYFTKDFSENAPQLIDQGAISFGGKLHFETDPLAGITGGVSFYTANGLGLNPDNPAEVDATLPGKTINVLGEAYVQYNSSTMAFTLGRQEITTPFAHQSDARMIPVTFEAASFNYKLSDLSIGANYLTKVKDRVSDRFVNTGLYATTLYKVVAPTDTGGIPVLSLVYDDKSVKFQVWNYYLSDLFNLAFMQGDYIFNAKNVKPFVSAQFVREWDVGSHLLGQVDSTAYGVLVGIKKGQSGLTAGFNYVPFQAGAFRNGGVLSPYTLATDPLYTTSMTAGLVEKSTAFAGKAYKIGGSYALESWLLLVSYAKYDLNDNPGGKNSSEVDFDATYNFQGWLQGLSARNRLGVVNSQVASEKLIYNRIQLQYKF